MRKILEFLVYFLIFTYDYLKISVIIITCCTFLIKDFSKIRFIVRRQLYRKYLRLHRLK